jgi:hypothetical protein
MAVVRSGGRRDSEPDVVLGNCVVVFDEYSRIVHIGRIEVDDYVHHEEDVEG